MKELEEICARYGIQVVYDSAIPQKARLIMDYEKNGGDVLIINPDSIDSKKVEEVLQFILNIPPVGAGSGI